MSHVATTEDAFSSPSDAALVTALGTRSIVLVGMMGAGKSSIGRRLAARLGLAFIDADNEIEERAGRLLTESSAVLEFEVNQPSPRARAKMPRFDNRLRLA